MVNWFTFKPLPLVDGLGYGLLVEVSFVAAKMYGYEGVLLWVIRGMG